MSSIAIYCRVSTQMQTTDRQREELLARAENKNVQIDENHIFVDVISGFTRGDVRPQYTELMDAVERGEIEEIWFSELTRLGRSSVELLSEIERFQEKGVTLYFQKQDLTVSPNKSDIGSRILLNVLAVCASYEIELFAERSQSGKITKVKNGGGIGGDNGAYGYTNNKNKKMVIRPEEAKIIKYIFDEYVAGKSTIEIAESLNAKNTPTALIIRTEESSEKRANKGLAEKENIHFSKSTRKWKASMVSKILNRDLYTGHRHIVFRKPNVSKKEKDVQKNDREIIYEYDEHVEDLRIISDELFQQAQNRLLRAPYNKNNSLKHENLLKHKMKCGECGSNFTVGKSTSNSTTYLTGGRTYKCYGTVNRKDKPRICETGADIKQWRLDGLVLALSLRLFAQIDLDTTLNKQISNLSTRNAELESLIQTISTKIENETKEYKKQINRLSKLDDGNNDVIEELMKEETEKFSNNKNTYEEEIKKYTKEKVSNLITINNLKKMSKYDNLYNRMDEIWRNKEVVKTMVDELIKEVVLFRPHKNWLLVVVRYENNVEMWGTLKTVRYKKSEHFYDETLCRHGIEFHCWMINNTGQHFHYNRDEKTFTYDGESEIYTAITAGTYTFEELQEVLYATEWIGCYPYYCYENNECNITPPENIPENY